MSEGNKKCVDEAADVYAKTIVATVDAIENTFKHLSKNGKAEYAYKLHGSRVNLSESLAAIQFKHCLENDSPLPTATLPASDKSDGINK